MNCDGIIVVAKTQTCGACPSQWDAVTSIGESLYIRYRHGFLSVQRGGAGSEDYLFDEKVGDDFDGVMDWETVKEHTGLADACG